MEQMKEDDFSDWYHRVLREAEVVDDRYSIKGMTVYRRWGSFMHRRMRDFLEDLLEEDGHEPVQFPVLIPEDVLAKEKDHIAGFTEQVFWITHAGKNPLERKMALRPTSETAMYPIFALWVRSKTDLPLKVHQSCAVYRYETKHTRPLIRGREFYWNEGHTAFASNEEAEENIETIKGIYGKLINELLCLPYQINKRPPWDKFPGAEYTLAFETIMPDGRTLQLATAHNLGQNFAKVFDLKYEDDDGSHKLCHQTSYGPGFGRLITAVISVHGDEKGMILPPAVAPVQVVVVPIVFKESEKEKILKKVNELEKKIKKMGLRAVVDDSDERPGAKYYKWEQKGVPLRIELGPKDLAAGKVVAVRRDTGEKNDIKFEKISDIGKILDDITDNLRKTAKKSFDERCHKAKNLDDLKKYVGAGIVETGWCQTDDCAKPIDQLGTILTLEDKPAKCAVCGGQGKYIRVAKTY